MPLVNIKRDRNSLFNSLDLAFKVRRVESDLFNDPDFKDSLTGLGIDLETVAAMLGLKIVVKEGDQEPTEEELGSANSICLRRESSFYSLYATNEQYAEIPTLAEEFVVRDVAPVASGAASGDAMAQAQSGKIYKIQLSQNFMAEHNMLSALYLGLLLNDKGSNISYAQLAMDCLADPARYIASKFGIDVVVTRNNYQPAVRYFKIKNCIILAVDPIDDSCGIYLTEAQLKKIENESGDSSFKTLLHERDIANIFEIFSCSQFEPGTVEPTTSERYIIIDRHAMRGLASDEGDCEVIEYWNKKPLAIGEVNNSLGPIDVGHMVPGYGDSDEDEELRRAMEQSLEETEEAAKLADVSREGFEANVSAAAGMAAGRAVGMAPSDLEGEQFRMAGGKRYSALAETSTLRSRRGVRIVDITEDYDEHQKLMLARQRSLQSSQAGQRSEEVGAGFASGQEFCDSDEADLQRAIAMSLGVVAAQMDETEVGCGVAAGSVGMAAGAAAGGAHDDRWRAMVDASRTRDSDSKSPEIRR